MRRPALISSTLERWRSAPGILKRNRKYRTVAYFRIFISQGTGFFEHRGHENSDLLKSLIFGKTTYNATCIISMYYYSLYLFHAFTYICLIPFFLWGLKTLAFLFLTDFRVSCLLCIKSFSQVQEIRHTVLSHSVKNIVSMTQRRTVLLRVIGNEYILRNRMETRTWLLIVMKK